MTPSQFFDYFKEILNPLPMNEFYHSNVPGNDSQEDVIDNNSSNRGVFESLHEESSSCLNQQITSKEVEAALKKLKQGKASSCEGIGTNFYWRSGRRGFDSQPCHDAIALVKKFALNFSSPPSCKMGTQLQASHVLVCWGIGGAALWRHSYAE
ncbi:hypothetical protein ElyMa_001788100 [Elysia marginata]|uniref:Uncharacterized protein n=1 Tax=Elysia marginata TaxID=1093978 RepID=A0AAV4EEW0_9GAST|nr:hypothetical protein ElyMa_001788100 [Elysia marginata]